MIFVVDVFDFFKEILSSIKTDFFKQKEENIKEKKQYFLKKREVQKHGKTHAYKKKP